MITKGIAAACVYQKLTVPKQQRQLNHLLKSWELSQHLVSALQEDFLVFFVLKDQCHHAWLSMGIDDAGDSNPVAC